MVEQRALGLLMAVIATTLYLYYTVWMLMTPFIDADHSLQDYFPDRMYGVMGPTLFGYLLISVCFTTMGIVLVNDSQER